MKLTPDLPQPICSASMVSHLDGGVVLVGGQSGHTILVLLSPIIYKQLFYIEVFSYNPGVAFTNNLQAAFWYENVF